MPDSIEEILLSIDRMAAALNDGIRSNNGPPAYPDICWNGLGKKGTPAGWRLNAWVLQEEIIVENESLETAARQMQYKLQDLVRKRCGQLEASIGKPK